LTDPAFSEEFDTIVDDLTDQYVENEFDAAERERIEKYFLRAAERQTKLEFASELLRMASVERGDVVAATAVQPVAASEPGVFDRVRAFWRGLSVAHVVATAAAVIAIAIAVSFLPRGDHSSGSFATVDLTISSSTRALGAVPARVRLQPGDSGIRINLTIPQTYTKAKDYRVKLVSDDATERDLEITQRRDQIVSVLAPANRGSYVIQVSAVNADGTEQRIPGSYFLNVE
jgi:hypothetical protein